MALFRSRFPDLAVVCALETRPQAEKWLNRLPADVRLEACRNGDVTILSGERSLHSRYNPVAEAENILKASKSFREEGCVFAGFGLAYLPELYAIRYPESTIVIVESDPALLALALASRPLQRLFSHTKLLIVCGAEPEELPSILERTGLQELSAYASPAITSMNPDWYARMEISLKRWKDKRQINRNTLRRFGDLWLKNMCRNLAELERREGISRFSGMFTDIPVLLLAAGPSLDEVLPALQELKKKCVVIAVDTAVRACMRVGVEPDFIVVADPQYWNWRHFDGQSCPKSYLITELAAWPAVFRFPCRAIHLFSSRFPLAHFLEQRLGLHGELGAGGSVATTAWDFAAYVGTPRIYLAALDLGFPDLKTHFTGSIFEDRTHCVSTRFATSETAGYLALYGAHPYPVPDYRGRTVLTDHRLSLYAWWFENRLAQADSPETATLTHTGMKIAGINPVPLNHIQNLPDRRDEINRRLNLAQTKTGARSKPRNMSYHSALNELIAALEDLEELASRGMSICDRMQASVIRKNRKIEAESFTELDRIDTELISHPAKELAAMIFDRFRNTESESSTASDPVSDSKEVYSAIKVAAQRNIHLIRVGLLRQQEYADESHNKKDSDTVLQPDNTVL